MSVSICDGSEFGPWIDGGTTACFNEFVVFGFHALLFLLIMGPTRLYQLYYSNARREPKMPGYGFRVVCSLLLVLLPLVDMLWRYLDFTLYKYIILGDCLQVAAWSFSLIVLSLENSKGLTSNFSLTGWWMFAFMAATLKLQTVVVTVKATGSLELPLILFFVQLLLYLMLSVVGILCNGTSSDDNFAVNVRTSDSQSVSVQEGETMPLLKKKKDVEEEAGPRYPVSPEASANWLSLVSFWWSNSLFKYGKDTALEGDDLWPLMPQDSAEVINARFMARWRQEEELPREQRSLARAIRKTVGTRFAQAGILKLINDVLLFSGPLLMNLIITFISTPEWPLYYGVLIALAMFVLNGIMTACLHQYFHIVYRTGLRVRSAMVMSTFGKSFDVSNTARQEYTTGEITNFMSIDAARLQALFTYLHMVWSAPFQIIVSVVLLYNLVGPAVFVGVGFLILMMPLQLKLLKTMSKYQGAMMKNKDSRIKIMNEVLSGIRIIKFFAWEQSYVKAVNDVREKELVQLKTAQYLSAATSFMWGAVPIIVSLLTFLTFSLLGNELTAGIAFTALSLFNVLRFPLVMLPMLLNNLVNAKISIERVGKYLTSPAREDSVEWHDGETNEFPLQISDGTFSWGEVLPVLKDVNLKIPRGKLVAIVGSVGSGKSSLLSAFLGDLNKLEGSVHVFGSLAYASQQAWIQNATVRDNILFGKPYSETKYKEAIRVSELESDLEMLPGGDSTEIGEKGINLSGGQKQRVSIARCVYADKQVYLLDDILSAVDVHVGRNIFDRCLKGALKGRTIAMVTHQLQYLSEVDSIILMHEGRVHQQGTYAELMADSEGKFSKLITQYSIQGNGAAAGFDSDAELLEETSDLISAFSKEPPQEEEAPKVTKKIIEEEEREHGRLNVNVYWKYMTAVGGVLTVAIILFMILIERGTAIGANYWLSAWSGDVGFIKHDLVFWLGLYSVWSLLSVVLTLTRSLFTARQGIQAASYLHEKLITRVIRAPTSFFDTTPIGRIINRFSSDIYTIDENLASTLNTLLMMMSIVLGTVVVISTVTPLFLFFLFPLGILYRYLQQYYIGSSREIKRLDSISKSPIYNHFTETLDGVSTVRSYGLEQQFAAVNRTRLDVNQRAYYTYITANRWLGIRLEMVGNSIIILASMFAVLSRGTIDPGLAGLSITYALSVTQALNWLVRQITEAETMMVSVERVDHYSHCDQEPAAVLEGDAPPEAWPTEGRVEFIDYQFRYRAGLDLVLKGISVRIEGGQKVGICGRTGAGKSSLVLALFRFVDAAGGAIEIDGLNIERMGTDTLRRALTIIPQDPVLFSGTLRRNLDPFNEVEDARVWDALEKVHMRREVEAMEGLQTPVAEAGDNFSVGQRQLLCLARALLRDAKILIMDEATSNVDAENDSLIQETIREAFAKCTVLTIAHRINTIVDSDMILVLDAGKVAEYDTPERLMADSSSVFYSMINETTSAGKEEEVN